MFYFSIPTNIHTEFWWKIEATETLVLYMHMFGMHFPFKHFSVKDLSAYIKVNLL